MDKLFKLTHSIPKIELHAHLGGCFRPQTFVDLAELKKIDIDHIDFYHVDIKTAFEIFKVGGQLITDCKTLRRVTKEVVEDYSKQSCRYLELRSTPKVIGTIESREIYVQTVIEALIEAETEHPNIRCAYLASINRAASEEILRETIDLVVDLKSRWASADATDEQKALAKKLVGVELSGDPRVGFFDQTF